MKYLVSNGADINARTLNGGETPLHLAVLKDNLEVVKYLVSRWADINDANIYGWTPLHRAAQNGNLEIMRYLVSSGAEINSKDAAGKNVLFHAYSFGQGGFGRGDTMKQIWQYLFSAGVDPTAKNMYGRTLKQEILYEKYNIKLFASETLSILDDYEKQYQLKTQLAQQHQKESEQREKEEREAEKRRLKVEADNKLVLLKNKQACKLQETGWFYLGSACNGNFAHGLGKAENPSSELLFEGTFFNGNRTEGVVYYQGTPLYEGKIVDGKPDGNGICYHQGEPEECRYYKGKRVDGLYKQRLEMAVQQQYMEMLKAEMDKMKEQQANGAGQPGSITDGVKNALMDKAAKKAADMIFDHLF